MKTAQLKLYNRPKKQLPYPNAATRQEILHKVTDALLLAASGVGIAAILLLVAVL